MDSNQPPVYLDVPVTDAERAQARRRQDDSSDRLLPEAVHQHPEDSSSWTQYNAPTPSRFPSIRGAPAIRQIPPSFSKRFEPRQYVPISPIHEEDEPESIRLQEPSIYNKSDEGSLLRLQPPAPPLWTPIWLKKMTLILFAIFFALLVLALALLWHFDRTNDGFHVASDMKHYAWAYAPTVIAVVIVAVWRLVDYHAKLAMPFDALQDGPIKASESLFVDYISKFQLVALFEATRNNHFAVMATVVGFILLKVATMFSTGLLVPLPTQVKQSNAPIQARGFSADSFDPNTPLTSLSVASPVYAYYGSKTQGIPLENGVALDLAYGAFTVPSNTSIGQNAIITGDVQAFIPNVTCSRLDVNLDTPAVVNDTNSANAFASSSNISFTIQAGDACSRASSVSVPAYDPYTEIVPGHQLTGTMQEIYCGTTVGDTSDSQGPRGLLFTLTDIKYEQTLFDNATQLAGGTFTIASDVSRTLTNMTNVFCKPSYTMTEVKVTNKTQLSGSRQGISIESGEGSNSSLPNFSNWNATNVFLQSATSADALFGDIVNDDNSSNSSGIFTLMALGEGDQDISSLLDADKMISAAQDTYKGVLAQYAHLSLRATNTSNIDGGSLTNEERRLRVNDVSVWTMASIFGILVIICIALVFIAPRAVVPRDPSSIAAIATILTRSTELNRLLRKQGVPNLANQQSALSGFEFGTAIAITDSGTTSFKIVASEGEPMQAATKPNMDLKWWLPFTASLPVLFVTLALPVVLIAVLEVVQHSSNKHNGLYTVADDKWTEIYSHYIPGIVTLIVASLVNMLDFNAALFAPWANLAKGDAISRKSVLHHLLGLTPPWAFLRAIRTRYVGALSSILAAGLASVLTILVSALYTVQHVTVNGPDITLTQLDSFSLQWPNSFSTDNGAAAVVDLIMHQDVSYPQFTYQGLVFPKLSLNNSEASSDSASVVSGSSSHILPAVRANLRCEILPNSSFNVSTEQAGSDSAFATDQAFVTATASLPASCQLGGSSGSENTVTYENNFELPSGGGGTYAGAQLDLLFGSNASTYGNYGESRGQYIGDNPAVGCPSLAFTFGHFKLDSTDQSQVTTMICYQEIQALKANVTLKDDSTSIDRNNPPTVQSGSVSLRSNPISTTGANSFDFRIQNNLAQEMTLFNGANGTPTSNPSATDTFDIYFQAVINGTNKHDPAALVGANNQGALVDAVIQFYQIYMAQAISTNMRTSSSSSSSSTNSSRLTRRQSPTTTSTTATTVTRSRLVQDKDSKLELQVILGVIVGLCVASWLTTKMRRVLPCNPCSLAGTMSLLAGSDLCHSVDDGLCECCGKPRRRSFGYDADDRPESIHAAPEDEDEDEERQQIIPDGAEWVPQPQFETAFGGRRYSMGWWRERRAIGKRRRFGVDVGVRADGADDQDWELGQRRPEGSGFADFMMRGGDRDGRGEYSRFGSRGRDLSPGRPTTTAAGERDVIARPPRATTQANPNPSCPVHGGVNDDVRPPPATVAPRTRTPNPSCPVHGGVGGGGGGEEASGPATITRREGSYLGGEA
ncbi:hypothetical protein LTS17_004450 [Exophiala oligosperma]